MKVINQKWLLTISQPGNGSQATMNSTLKSPHYNACRCPPIVVQGRYAPRRNDIDPNWVLELWGKTLEEVKRDHFNSIGQFDRCLQSWAVLNGQKHHRLKTKWPLTMSPS